MPRSFLCVCILALASIASAQQPTPAGQTAANPVAPKPVNDWKAQHDRQLLEDFPWLAHFRALDAALPAPATGEVRIVYMGDSITENWQRDGVPVTPTFPANPTTEHWVKINRGISAQTSPQMVLRFRQDVIDLKPSVVLLLTGTNDIAGNTGPMTLEDTENNIASMADLATANHIQMVLCSVLPSVDFRWIPGLQPAEKIKTLNAWIKAYAASHNLVYVDYWSALADPEGGLPANLSKDGVHPTSAGYAIMNPLADAGIRQALAKK
uniref:Putative acylhydrolase n=1 Tax=mine drainage metagenome TaxID=410659 RepID=E6QK55_9ZZZZ